MRALGTITLGAALAAALAAQGCASDPGRLKAFSTGWRDDRGQSISEVYERLKSAPSGPRADLVVSVLGNGKLVGTPLGGGAPWTATHALDARPVIAGGVVVVSGEDQVSALDATSGQKLWSRPTGGLPLLGAGDDGELTAVTLSRGQGKSTLLVVARDGAVKHQIEAKATVGAPAVVGGVVFVPWSNQYVSALDGRTGREIGRVTLREKVSRAQTIGGALFFGELAFVRFDDQIGHASRGQASRVGVPERELPGTPRIMPPGTERVPAFADARDRGRLFGRPTAEGALAIDSGRFYATYFKLAFGFESTGGELGWVKAHAHDFIGGEAVRGGLVLCDEEGKIIVLSSDTGQVALETGVGQPVKSCVVRADTFEAPKVLTAGPSLGEQITHAVTLREGTLATAQRLLLRELATAKEESATKTLIDIATDPRSAPVLVADARAALAARRNGASFMLEALGKRYDYLRDVLVSPPVGPLADALSSMKEPSAAPLLAAQLLDPHVTDDDVKRAAAALALLGTDEELPRLKQFFAMYRGTADTDELASAVGSVAEAMLRLDAKGSRPIVEHAASDAMTTPLAKERLAQLLAAVGASSSK